MLDIKFFFGIVAIVLNFVAYAPYIRDIIKGKTTPHAFTWFLFGLINAFVFGLQISSGAGIGAFVSLAISVTVFFIFVLSLYKGEKKITISDIVFFVLALIALILWVYVKQPVFSTILLSITNILAFAPTVRKSWEKPFSETFSTYVMNGSKHAINLIALEHYNIVTYLFPLSASIITFAFVFMLIFRRRILKTKIF